MNPYTELFAKMKKEYVGQRYAPYLFRLSRLKRLRESLLKHKEEIYASLNDCLGRPTTETDILEFLPVIVEINDAIKNLKRWMKPKKSKTPLLLFGTRSQVRFEPKGLALIIAPWNYPLALAINPLISAVAAGNRCVIKPSELAPQVASILKKIVSDTFDENQAVVIEGGVEVSQALLELPFDHIFFTGSTAVGKSIMAAAAKNLTPVTLELGGKSPAIVDSGADLRTSVERIVWGKFVNSGQTCIAPDYVLVPAEKRSEFVKLSKEYSSKLFGGSNSYSHIINEKHFKRLKGLIADGVKRGAKVEMGGVFNDSKNEISPTLLVDVPKDAAIMHEEIFGPVLPVLTYSSRQEIYDLVESQGKPLALYIFSKNNSVKEEILNNISSGGACLNSTLIQYANANLPFGGVGPSGMGNYHGFYGFKAFSHERAVLAQGFPDFTKILFPPYKVLTRRLVDFALKYLA